MVPRALPLIGAVAAVAAVACGSAMELDVGSNAQTAAPEVDASTAPRTFGTTDPSPLTTRLAKLCAAPAGQPDFPTSAAELTQRLRGRWYRCPNAGAWEDSPPEGLELTFGATGAYAYLTMCESASCARQAPDGFYASTDPDHSGQVLYLAFCGTPGTFDAGPGGGEGGTSEGGADSGSGGAQSDASSAECQQFVPVDDSDPLNGIFVYLTRADAADFELQLSFEKGPRRMTVHELGSDPAFAVFVPID